MSGWIKLHRRLKDNPIYGNSTMLHLFVELLFRANFEDKIMYNGTQKITIKKGQAMYGYKEMAAQLKCSVGSIHKYIKLLEQEQIIENRSTNKGSIATIINWKKHQIDENGMKAKRKRNEPTKNVKNAKNLVTNVTSEISKPKDPINELIGRFDKINPSYKTLYPKMGQRRALERMINEHGREKVELILEGAIYAYGKPYAPTITTPFELEQKLGALTAFLQREKWQTEKFAVTKL